MPEEKTTRAEFLADMGKCMLAGAMCPTLASLLASCGSDDDSSTITNEETKKPQKKKTNDIMTKKDMITRQKKSQGRKKIP